MKFVTDDGNRYSKQRGRRNELGADSPNRNHQVTHCGVGILLYTNHDISKILDDRETARTEDFNQPLSH